MPSLFEKAFSLRAQQLTPETIVSIDEFVFMKISLTVLAVCFCLVESFPQLTPTVNPVIDQFGSIQTRNTGGPKGNGQQTVYLYDTWTSADILIHQPGGGVVQVRDVRVKLDLMTNNLEVQAAGGIKVLPFSKVEKFEWTNPVTLTPEVFTNGRQFSLNGVQLESFCSVFGDQTKMVTHYAVEVIPADYNVALDVGNKEDRVIKKVRHYLLRGNELVEFTRKSVVALMADDSEHVKQFIKKNHVDFDQEADLQSLVRYCDTLVQ